EHVADRYAGFLRWGLEHKLLIGAVVAVAFVVSIAFTPLLATEFFPKVDAGEFILNVAAPEGTRLEKTEAIVAKVEDVIRQVIPKQELNQLVEHRPPSGMDGPVHPRYRAPSGLPHGQPRQRAYPPDR